MAKSSKIKKIIDSGASMMEFTIGFPVVILCIVFLIDTGLYLFQRSLLTDGTATLSRQIVTTLGQRHANCPTPGSCSCSELISAAYAKRVELTSANPELYPNTTFRLEISATAPVITPYRLVILSGERNFQCLTCKFFPISLPMRHKSVLSIERPTINDCASISETTI